MPGGSTTVDDVVQRSGRGLDLVLATIERLEDGGHLVQDGPWLRRGGR
jgi:hypothetical protein